MSAHAMLLAIVIAWLALAAAVFVTLFFVTAPYGRYVREGWGPTLSSRLGWVFMEAPAALVAVVGFVLGTQHNATAWTFLVMWELHYVYRAFVYPFTLRDDGRRMPVSVVGMAFVFNSVNAGLNAWWLFDLSGGYPATWLLDPRFVAGAALFLAGMAVNRGADATLRHLHDEVPSPYGADTSSCTAAPETYRIPHGGLYRRISCPNYLGEIVQWCGWALATWSLPGLAFAAWTAANLVPRAGANHAWYRERFPNYPPERRALLPGLW